MRVIQNKRLTQEIKQLHYYVSIKIRFKYTIWFKHVWYELPPTINLQLHAPTIKTII